MTTQTPTINNPESNRCPLCNQANHCGLISGEEPCWCANRVIPKSLLEQIPEQLKNKACICNQCLNSYHE